MADETNASIQSASPQGQQDGGFRGGRGGREGGGREGAGREGGGREGGNREPGGFRIRLSENEMRAARAIQEAFGLRSTVAALGLSLRTVAQLLEQGQLDEVVAAQRAQAGPRPEGGRPEGGRPEGRREPRGGGGAGGRGERPAGNSRPNPFARPSKPVAVAEEPLEVPAEEAAPAEAPFTEDSGAEGSPGAVTEIAATDIAAADTAELAPAAEPAAPEA